MFDTLQDQSDGNSTESGANVTWFRKYRWYLVFVSIVVVLSGFAMYFYKDEEAVVVTETPEEVPIVREIPTDPNRVKVTIGSTTIKGYVLSATDETKAETAEEIQSKSVSMEELLGDDLTEYSVATSTAVNKLKDATSNQVSILVTGDAEERLIKEIKLAQLMQSLEDDDLPPPLRDSMMRQIVLLQQEVSQPLP